MLGTGAALENIVPPVPADTFVLLGAFLSVSGRADPWAVFFVTWTANVGSAILVYLLAWRFGPGFFRSAVGRWLLLPRQLEEIDRFYDRWGPSAIFASRFLPAFRAVVPVFAGVSRVPIWRVAPAVVAASAIWYGGLVLMGTIAGRNWDAIVATFSRMSGVLGWLAFVCLILVVVWWVQSRRRRA